MHSFDDAVRSPMVIVAGTLTNVTCQPAEREQLYRLRRRRRPVEFFVPLGVAKHDCAFLGAVDI
jgi:hypothetical protein